MMKFADFLQKAPLTKDDLFSHWDQKGVNLREDIGGDKAAEKLQWMRIRVKRMIRAKELKIASDAIVKFARGKCDFAKVAEKMTVSDGKDLLMTIVTGGGELKVIGGSAVAEAKAPVVKKGKGKKTAAEPVYVKSAREIQEETPYELRTGWTNYDLLEKINEEACEISVKYWNEHDGKFPKRKMRKS